MTTAAAARLVERRAPERRGWTRRGENWERGEFYVSPTGVKSGCGVEMFLLFKTAPGRMAELFKRNVTWVEIEELAERRRKR